MEQNNSNKVRLQDVLQYTPDAYFSDDEMDLVRNAFNGAAGKRLLKVIRKVMLPTISDPDLPIEEINKDVTLAGIDMLGLAAEHLKPIVLGRQEAIKFVVGGLIMLQQMANIKEEPEQNRALRRAKDSTK
jgi:hypothetical protein